MANQGEWDTYFQGIAEAAAVKSKDECKVGCVIVRDNLIISTGFNGLPRHLPSNLERVLVGGAKDDKLSWMVHAEANAVFNAARTGASTVEATLYVNKFPCYRCIATIIQAGIARVYTPDREFWEHDPADLDHNGKRFLIDTHAFELDAPNHPEYGAKPLPKLRTRRESHHPQSFPPDGTAH